MPETEKRESNAYCSLPFFTEQDYFLLKYFITGDFSIPVSLS